MPMAIRAIISRLVRDRLSICLYPMGFERVGKSHWKKSDANDDEVSDGGNWDEVLRMICGKDEGTYLEEGSRNDELARAESGENAPGVANSDDK